MRPRSIWLAARSAELRAALLDLGLTVTDAQAQTILADKISEHITLIGISRRTAQNAFTEERLLAFAQSLAVSLSDEAPAPTSSHSNAVFPCPLPPSDSPPQHWPKR